MAKSLLMNKYQCPRCGMIVERESDKKRIKSYCSEADKSTYIKLLTVPAYSSNTQSRE